MCIYLNLMILIKIIRGFIRTLRTLGVPYTDQEISDARLQIRGKTKAEALIRYLQSLGQDTAQEVAQ
ncbi:hypothetical protein VroAM7_47590 [Vibrio rotiferianus]|uniref:Uncharacterized protein n=1 Tax=Vibrio rotiferianus TaxID=190895 RepID=A0A510II24_9VIBR|nr:hypothetical protein VroAM7_47590 [Vibrio rotiferianus]